MDEKFVMPVFLKYCLKFQMEVIVFCRSLWNFKSSFQMKTVQVK